MYHLKPIFHFWILVLKRKNVVPTGVPPTDVLFDEAYATQIKQEMEDELPNQKGKKKRFFSAPKH